MKDRITEFLVKENISPAEFADKIGVQRSSVSHVLNGRNYPGASFIQKMLSIYKGLNPRWLLLGEGMMMETNNSGKEPSLFSFPFSEDREENRKSLLKSLTSKSNDESTSPEGNEKLTETKPLPTTKETKQELNDVISNIADNKDIDRIVLFYKDKTFSVYTPSK